MSKMSNAKSITLHVINVRFVACRVILSLIVGFMEVFQAVEGVDSDERVSVGDVLLPESVLLFVVLLRIVLMVELPEGNGIGGFLIPTVKCFDALSVFLLFVGCGVADSPASYKTDADKCTDTLDNREMEFD